ncbi:MAG TPA: DUF6167 family protein [Nocardioidaceae bacterium]|nr:DUF6167 family protein [Nocardioidaceae bacterium]
MSRLVWFAAGAGAGVYALTRVRRVAEVFTPEGLADRLAGLSLGLHLFRDEVRAGMAEKEKDLRQRLAVPPPGGVGELPPGGTPRLGGPVPPQRAATGIETHPGIPDTTREGDH